MVISFTNDYVFNYLKNNGYVVTFRKNRRASKHESTWVRRSRGDEKEFDCYITEIGKVEDPKNVESSPNLKEFVQVNGLPSNDVRDWLDTIRSLNEGLPDTGYLYMVTTKNLNEEQQDLS